MCPVVKVKRKRRAEEVRRNIPAAARLAVDFHYYLCRPTIFLGSMYVASSEPATPAKLEYRCKY